jgi:hypothetical protein
MRPRVMSSRLGCTLALLACACALTACVPSEPKSVPMPVLVSMGDSGWIEVEVLVCPETGLYLVDLIQYGNGGSIIHKNPDVLEDPVNPVSVTVSPETIANLSLNPRWDTTSASAFGEPVESLADAGTLHIETGGSSASHYANIDLGYLQLLPGESVVIWGRLHEEDRPEVVSHDEGQEKLRQWCQSLMP